MENKKKEYGQFFTKNTRYIVDRLYTDIPYDKEVTVVDPFAGEEDLLKYVRKYRRNALLEAYDIDPKTDNSMQNDSLMTPLDLGGKWVVTNPPYLAKNKTDYKEPFLKYETDDLYKCSLKMISGFCGNTPCEGGFIIIPLNFFSDRDDATRRWFLSRYKIGALRIFEEKVFSDTDYTVCCFSFTRKDNIAFQRLKAVRFLPEKEDEKRTYEYRLSYNEGFRIGSPFFRILKKHKDKKSRIRVERLVKDKEIPEGYYVSRLLLRAIDTGTNEGRIQLSVSDEPHYGKISDRTVATMVTSKPLTREQEELIAHKFNVSLEGYRKAYHSLILTNFRNSTALYARKRLEFKTAFDLLEFVMWELKIK